MASEPKFLGLKLLDVIHILAQSSGKDDLPTVSEQLTVGCLGKESKAVLSFHRPR